MTKPFRLVSALLCGWGLLAGSGLLSRTPAQAQQGDTQTIRGFEVPEFDRENRLRSRLFGDFAKLLPGGLVDITQMRIDFYDDNREVEMRVTAETCLYNRVNKSAESETAIRIARNNMIITGTGFNWNAEDGHFKIHNNAKVVFSDLRSIRQGEAEAEQKEEKP